MEHAPKTLLGINNAIDFKDALSADDPRYVETAKARDERFEKHFLEPLGTTSPAVISNLRCQARPNTSFSLAMLVVVRARN